MVTPIFRVTEWGSPAPLSSGGNYAIRSPTESRLVDVAHRIWTCPAARRVRQVLQSAYKLGNVPESGNSATPSSVGTNCYAYRWRGGDCCRLADIHPVHTLRRLHRDGMVVGNFSQPRDTGTVSRHRSSRRRIVSRSLCACQTY